MTHQILVYIVENDPIFAPQTSFFLQKIPFECVKKQYKKVKVIFDCRKTVAKTGTGSIDICVYLKEGQRKFESVGSATPEE